MLQNHQLIKLLVIAQSGRMLAQMAVAAGFTPLVVDCFADTDTRQLAPATVKVASLAVADVAEAVSGLRRKHGLTQLVYGSGFEQHTETLAFLAQDWQILGNPAALFRRFQDKQDFFRQLAALAIPYPPTLFAPPDSGAGWLYKTRQGEGGQGVRHFNAKVDIGHSHGYWQRRLDGEPMSVTFVAGGGKLKILGFNRQWSAATAQQPYLFAGVVSQADLPVEHQALLTEWLQKLLTVYPLQGLGSLDFLWLTAGCYVLELNARIPASAQLYGATVFSGHVLACQGDWQEDYALPPSPWAYQIVYAPRDVQMPAAVCWPDWLVDRPENGAIIGKGQPICSIISAIDRPAQAADCLSGYRQFIENILNTGP